MIELRGSISEIEGVKEDWCRIRVHTGSRTYAVTGMLRKPAVGDCIELEGHLDYAKSGEQVKARLIRRVMPKTESEIRLLLRSLNLSMQSIADNVIHKEGRDVLLKLMTGTARTPFPFAESLIDRLDDAQAHEFMVNYGLKAQQAQRITEQLAQGSEERCIKGTVRRGRLLPRLKRNPYVMAEAEGLDFRLLDGLILSKGTVPPDDPRRLIAAAKYVLRQAGNFGHTCMDVQDVIKELAALGLRTSERLLGDAIKTVKDVEQLRVDGANMAHPSLWYAEDMINVTLRGLKAQPVNLELSLPSNLVRVLAGGGNIDCESSMWLKALGVDELTEEQAAAVQNAIGPVSVITGGPGCGKTTTVKAIINLLKGTTLCAPTGKAARRLREATGQSAYTLHMLMQAAKSGSLPEGASKIRTLVIDEASMLSVDLLSEALQLLQPSRLILVGDVDQLPAIGPGRVLGDIIDSKHIPCVRLTKVQRQAADSMIVRNAIHIKHGEALEHPADSKDFFLTRNRPEKHLDLLRQALAERIPQLTKANGEKINPLWDVQVLTPQHKGLTGVANLNRVLREILNPSNGQDEVKVGDYIIREGDKVMVTKNLRAKDVVNGEMGLAVEVAPNKVHVEFEALDGIGEKTVLFEREELVFLQPGFACTVHKSQGSEGPMVIAIFNEETPKVMRVRNLLYTALTRARERVWLLGDDQTLADCIANNRPSERKTQLKRMLGPQGMDIYPTGMELGL